MTPVFCTLSITHVESARNPVIFSATVIDVDRSQARALSGDEWLSPLRLFGVCVRVSFSGTRHGRVVLAPGVLVRMPLTASDIGLLLEAAVTDHQHIHTFTPDSLHPLSEPAVRVPKSLLMALRGQEVVSESSRRAILAALGRRKRV